MNNYFNTGWSKTDFCECGKEKPAKYKICLDCKNREYLVSEKCPVCKRGSMQKPYIMCRKCREKHPERYHVNKPHPLWCGPLEGEETEVEEVTEKKRILIHKCLHCEKTYKYDVLICECASRTWMCHYEYI